MAGTLRGAGPSILVVSGGAGASGEQLVQTALAQFPNHELPVRIAGNVRAKSQLAPLVQEAARGDDIIVHTLVDGALRRELSRLAERHMVRTVDAMGPLLDQIADVTRQRPVGQPGLYRQLQREYFERVSAIEYTMSHDDGLRPEDWPSADVVLVGVSRSGKTPLSVYMSVLGWKVANVPLVLDLPVPADLLGLDARRVIGLTLSLDRLLAIRKRRVEQMGLPAASSYVDPLRMQEELQFAARVCRQHGFRLIDVSDRPIESTADDIIRLLNRRPAHSGA